MSALRSKADVDHSPSEGPLIAKNRLSAKDSTRICDAEQLLHNQVKRRKPTILSGLHDVRFRSGLLTGAVMNKPRTLSDTLPLAIRNPSRKVAKRLLSVAVDGEVRGTIDPKTRDVLIWKATEATHKQVAESMNGGFIDRRALFRLYTSDQIDKMIVWP